RQALEQVDLDLQVALLEERLGRVEAGWTRADHGHAQWPPFAPQPRCTLGLAHPPLLWATLSRRARRRGGNLAPAPWCSAASRDNWPDRRLVRSELRFWLVALYSPPMSFDSSLTSRSARPLGL